LQSNLGQAQQRIKKYANLNKTERTFAEGHKVYLKMHSYRETTLGWVSVTPLVKLTSKWYGAFKVLKQIANTACKLQLSADTQLYDVFHINQLKCHLGKYAVPNQIFH
jgi:hypothetical protein